MASGDETEEVKKELEEVDLQQAIKRLDSWDSFLSARAVYDLERSGARAIEYLLPVLAAEEPGYRKRQHRYRLLRRGLIGMAHACAALLLLLCPYYPYLSERIIPFLMLLLICPNFTVEPALKYFARRSTKHKRALMALAHIEDLRVIGPLLEGYDEHTSEASLLLLRMLPRLRTTDRDLLTPQQYDCLLARLKAGAPPLRTLLSDRERRALGRAHWHVREDLRIALMKALEQIGDASAIPVVKRLARSHDKDLRMAAETCLEYLTATADADRSRQTLLRPSSSPDTPSEVLVRPAGQGAEAETTLLLRPSGTNLEKG